MFNPLNQYYNGIIDNLLDRCAQYDLNQLDETILIENAIEDIMRDSGEPREVVIQMLDQAHLNEVQQEVNRMMKEGLVEIVGYNDDGEPVYRLVDNKPKKSKKPKK